jgi:hypothetical protein
MDYGGGNYLKYGGTISGTASSGFLTLDELSASVTIQYYVDSQHVGNGGIEIRGEGPLSASDVYEGGRSFRASGLEVCEFVTSIGLEVNHSISGNYYLQNWDCNEGSSLTVTFASY